MISNYKNVNFIQIYGLMRSGNHAIIAWLMANLAGLKKEPATIAVKDLNQGLIVQQLGTVFHINNVRGNVADHIDFCIDKGATTILMSYEDQPVAKAADNHFLANARQITITRDLNNLLASRYKAMLRNDEWSRYFSFNEDLYRVWLQHRMHENTVHFEKWFTSKEYRDKISEKLGVENLDVTWHVSGCGKGSSFEPNIPDMSKLLTRYKQVELPEEWSAFLKRNI